MTVERLNKIQNALAELIRIVGNTNAAVEELRVDVAIRSEMDGTRRPHPFSPKRVLSLNVLLLSYATFCITFYFDNCFKGIF